ncbi:MAG: ABC transporter ATP-binding protein [Pyrinomonadaceae bacterium]|nr:ABC transporter ATP-binding protein [Pyrinomonadaceae bacterium]
MNYAVEIENLTKDYEIGFWKKKKVRALDGLTLNPSAGTAKILGKDIRDVKMHHRIGYCPENPYFYDYLTARELLNYFGELFGLDSVERNKRTEYLLSKVGLEEASWDKQLRKFSKGMLQRTGLAQSLINQPKIVFLDEPMSGLDPIGRREIRELIAELREQGVTVFMSTHILSDIEALCDRVAILRKGKLAATGKLDELLTETQHFEINVKGVSADILANEVFSKVKDATVNAKASGASVQVLSENDVDNVLIAIRKSGGNLVSVQPVKQSLEELFVKETE